MATAEDLGSEETKVRGYRFERLYNAGYEIDDARVIARRMDIDLHMAVETIRKCADSRLARRIIL